MRTPERKPFSLRLLGSYLVSAVISIGLTFASLRAFPELLPSARADNTKGQITLAQAQNPLAISPSNPAVRNFVSAAVNRVGPAVVRIDTERTVTRGGGLDPFFDDPFFRQFFGDGLFPQQPQREFRQQGQGSGFIVDSSGIILTNAHVVKGADRVSVVLRDGRQFVGVVRGADEPSDLA
ncbi:MAG: trypsin-like peptidase domain-containing protein, partial [Microcoleaceae cyanobacterium]